MVTKADIDELAKACSKNPDLEDKFSTVMNIAPFEPPPFRMTGDYQEYLRMNLNEKREYFERTAKLVFYDEEFENQKFRFNCLTIIRKSVEDSELRGYWKYRISNLEGQSISARVLGQRAVAAFGKNDVAENEERVNIPEALERYAKKRAYQPPGERLLITSNLTFNSLDELPVFSDVAGETLENIEIPDTLLYDYADVNKIYAGKESNLADLVELANKKENLIACNCCSSVAIVPCYENPECMCYVVNKKLQKLQGQRGPMGYTEFSTFKPILFTKATNAFYEHAGFACSDSCACSGRCTNNSLLMIEKRLFPLELYRNDLHIGFGIRTLAMIPAGTPVMEFVGDLTENLLVENQDYAYQVSYPENREIWDLILNIAEWTPEYKKKLEEVSHSKFFLDPKKYGNVARTALHSCTANMEVVRVFQKGLSPAHARLIMVTLDNIYPGTPLTIDYGPNYVEHQLQNACRCDSFACMNGEYIKKVKLMDFVQMGECFQKAANDQYRWWKEHIHDEAVRTAKAVKRGEEQDGPMDS